MLTEFKRDNKQRDYERMSEDLNRRKRELKSYEDQLRSRTGDILQMDQSRLDDKVSTTFQSDYSRRVLYASNDKVYLYRNCLFDVDMLLCKLLVIHILFIYVLFVIQVVRLWQTDDRIQGYTEIHA